MRCTLKSFVAESRIFTLAVLLVSSVHSIADNASHPAERCANCHAEQVAAWKTSHHFHAMGEATRENVLGNFSNQGLDYRNRKAHFVTRNNSFYVGMSDLQGELREFKVSHTFGYTPLQQYMFEWEPGKFQFFPFAWDSRPASEGGQRWFVLHPEQNPWDEFHWSQMGQNWNQMCADCHSTDYKKGFDLAKQTYHSTYSAINVSCDACHGDSEQHLNWAAGDTSVADKGFSIYIGLRSPQFRASAESKMQSVVALKQSQQVDVCAGCHSRRTAFSDRDKPQDFFGHYIPALITDDLYYLDGQVLEEDYVWGSFQQSKMHAAGVTCTNCHNPHSGELKLSKNLVCTQCHDTEKYVNAKHHGHKENTAGSFCVDCHMPTTTYMQVDARRDHNFGIPRPDLSQEIGVPNACNSCHQDKSLAWAEKTLEQWHPQSIYRNDEHFAQAFYAAASGSSDAAQKLTEIAQNTRYPDIVRASALHRMQQTPGKNAVVALVRATREDEPLKRIAAIAAAEPYALPDRWRMLQSLLDDPNLPVRAEAARSLAGLLGQSLGNSPDSGVSDNDKKRLQKALKEYREMQMYQADRGFSHTNLANLARVLGEYQQAENYYQQAIAIEPIFMPAYVNLADLYRSQQNELAAQAILKQALVINPDANAIHYAMALSLVRQNQKDQALEHLKKAATAGQPDSNSIYTYALLLQDRNLHDQALIQLQRAYELTPANPDISYSLSQLYLEKMDYDKALLYARKLNELIPGDPQLQNMLTNIEHLQKQSL